MKTPLHLLHVEDSPAHSEMVRVLLDSEGFVPRVTRVETAAQLDRALEHGSYDLILSDCTLPAFHGLAALELARERRPDIPFVFYSGTIGEEAAVESLKRGAMDFVPKTRAEKLVPTIRRVLQESQDRRLRREQAWRAQRVQSLGAFATGVAHALNNVLTSVLITANQLSARIMAEDDRRMLDLMRTEARRGSEMIQEILAFARGSSDELSPLELKQLMVELAGLLKVILPHSIQIDARTADQLYVVRGNATQLHQVLLNLCVNARDAMPEGGRLTLEAANVILDNRQVASRASIVSGPHVVLAVRDTGTGMAAELLDKIFEPFFTTKAVGNGAGLGLSTAREIVQRHGGFIEVASQLGQGTAFEVYLPALATPL